jgi:hypothetical protein
MGRSNHGYSSVIIVSYGLLVVNQYFVGRGTKGRLLDLPGSEGSHVLQQTGVQHLARRLELKGPTSRNEREKWGTPTIS